MSCLWADGPSFHGALKAQRARAERRDLLAPPAQTVRSVPWARKAYQDPPVPLDGQAQPVLKELRAPL